MLEPWNIPNAKLGAGTVTLHEGRVLLVRVNYGPAKGQWVLPGGKVEHNELITAAAERETLEETNVLVRVRGIVGIRQRLHPEIPTDVYFLFLAEVAEIRGPLRALDESEITGVAFWPVDEALRSPEVRPMAKTAIEWAVSRRNCLESHERPAGFTDGDFLFA